MVRLLLTEALLDLDLVLDLDRDVLVDCVLWVVTTLTLVRALAALLAVDFFTVDRLQDLLRRD